ncbi:MAG: hypothetical protein ABR956_02040 [Terracidiphilus sp.]
MTRAFAQPSGIYEVPVAKADLNAAWIPRPEGLGSLLKNNPDYPLPPEEE